MVDVHNPEYNREQVAKELLLLEAHANKPDAWCPECVNKHFLTAEAFAEEGAQLGDETMKPLAQKLRDLRKEVLGTSEHSHSDSEGEEPDPEPIRVERGKDVWVEVFHESEECHKGSFRTTIPNPEHRLTICCPKGQFDEEAQRCLAGTMAQRLEHLHPEGETCLACQGKG